tara:strand:- start:509 stop:868 length:360 start_codon:yes stop_codon:yes gene_type:complete
MISLLLSTLALNHVWLNKYDTKSFLKLYSPQQINGNLFCRVGINNYVKSVILMSSSKENIKGIYHINDKNLLLFSESENIVVKHILWNDNKEECFQEFLDYFNSFGVYKKIYSEYKNEV